MGNAHMMICLVITIIDEVGVAYNDILGCILPHWSVVKKHQAQIFTFAKVMVQCSSSVLFRETPSYYRGGMLNGPRSGLLYDCYL